MLWKCSETALKLLWNCSENALKLLWNCSENALKLPVEHDTFSGIGRSALAEMLLVKHDSMGSAVVIWLQNAIRGIVNFGFVSRFLLAALYVLKLIWILFGVSAIFSWVDYFRVSFGILMNLSTFLRFGFGLISRFEDTQDSREIPKILQDFEKKTNLHG